MKSNKFLIENELKSAIQQAGLNFYDQYEILFP